MTAMENNNIIRNYNISITTGHGVPQTAVSRPAKTEQGLTFEQIFQNQLKSQSTVNFSKHAKERISERNIDISAEKVEKLETGIKLAQQKGLGDTLIIVDNTLFVVNAKSSTVITTLNQSESIGNVITNIQGTVIV
ncbi:MAG TPA: flagellar protein [Ruminococcaceae bacterium]|nr:flagellar protein [Oscillospiraceae bacterium]